MLRKPSEPNSHFFSSLCRGISIPLGLFFLGGNGVVSLAASNSFLSDSSASSTRPSVQLIAQSEDDVPEVVIDEDPNDSSSTSNPNDPRFTCEMVDGEYTVMYHPESQPGEAYPWAVPSQMGGGWTSERRCYEIGRRLESYRPDGLIELTTSVENNYNILCVTTQQVPGCRIVLTVPPGQDPLSTRDRVFQNLTVADSGQQTQGVNTFVEGDGGNQIINQIGQVLNQDLSGLGKPSSSSRAIDLRPFLDRADGGTGSQLKSGNTAPSNSGNLNPDKFR